MKNVVRSFVRVLLILSGFLFIFNLPRLLGIGKNRIEVSYNLFWESVKSNFLYLLQFKDQMYLGYFKELDISGSYQYTMIILLASLLLIIVVSLAMAILIVLSPKKLRECLKVSINFFEAVPDLLVIFLFQFFVITLYRSTGLKFLQLYGVFGAKPYFVPIMTVSFLPLFLMLQFLIRVIMEEQNQQYVQYVKAKGMGSLKILLVHIFRNIFPLFVLQLRTIIWVLLSNIYLVEYMFNINGFSRQFEKIIFRGGDFATLIVCLLMLCFPLLVIESVGWLISKRIKGKGAIGL